MILVPILVQRARASSNVSIVPRLPQRFSQIALAVGENVALLRSRLAALTSCRLRLRLRAQDILQTHLALGPSKTSLVHVYRRSRSALGREYRQ